MTLEERNDTNFGRTTGNSVYANAQVPYQPDLKASGVLIPDTGRSLSTGPVIRFMVHSSVNKFIHKYKKNIS